MLNGDYFAADQIGWIDFETKSEQTIKAGSYRYASDPSTRAIICTYAIGDGPIGIVRSRWPQPLAWEDMPLELLKHHAKVMTGSAVWCAWNAGFDRAIWNFACPGFPLMEPQMMIDAMVQATVSGLPPDLKSAAKYSNSTHKVADADKLLKLFCYPGANATPQTHPLEWDQLCVYACGDIAAMRSTFKGTRQLPRREIREYWAMEAINDRGAAIDLVLAKSAAKLAETDKVHSATDMYAITDGVAHTVDHVAKLVTWLVKRLPAEGVDILTSREEVLDDNGEMVRPTKYSLKRGQVEKLIALCAATLGQKDTLRALQLRLYGGSKAKAKFARMLQQHVDGVLYGQYAFAGAPQTGRASSKGVQVHNLTRDFLPYEIDAIDAICAGCTYQELEQFGDPDMPVARKLSLLVRPTFVPSQPDNVLVWSDWSNIEARILPWLAGDDPGALARLDIFRAVDADPSVPDLYTRTAADLTKTPIADITKAIRQRGKVAELALGFGGGQAALAAMGASYGLYMPENVRREVVNRWREANPWCVKFWGKHDESGSYGLWGAANRAMLNPETLQQAGRISFYYWPDYLGGSLLMLLPSGRALTYRGIKYERVADLDDDDNVIGYSVKLRFGKGRFRSAIWHGIFCENAVQAVAADILRGTLVRLEDQGRQVRLHTHDEVLLETYAHEAETIVTELRVTMQQGFDWTEGLPIMSEETIAYAYSKNETTYLEAT